MGLYLPAIGIAFVFIGIVLESAHAFVSWGLRAEFAHAIGFFGLIVYAAGAIIEFKRHRALWQSMASAVVLGMLVSTPSLYARGWLITHHLTYFAAVGAVIAPFLIVGIVLFALAPVVHRLEIRFQSKRSRRGMELNARRSYFMVAVLCQLSASWYELWQQPYVAVSPHLGPRGYIEWGQVVADVTGIWLAFFFAKWADPTLVVERVAAASNSSVNG